MKRFLCFLLLFLILILPGCKKEVTTPAVDGWTLENAITTSVADGVSYTFLLFLDEEALRHQVHVLTADPNKVTLHKGTSNNGMALMPTEKQNVLEHLEASVRDGLDVVAAVNGDFFQMSSTFMPTGLSVKSGVVIKENTAFRPFSALTKDGRYIICEGTEKIDYNTLEMATGGSHVILKDRQLHDVHQQNEFSLTSHPRTLSGVKEDGTMLFVVIDGRQEEVSNGATLLQCGQLMLSLGAVNAINHDGGGSSTMILKADGRFGTANSPSDGCLRDVFCSIQIVSK